MRRPELSPSTAGPPLALAGLVGLAALFRFWQLDDLGLTHFDEGSYAMAGHWLATWGEEGAAIQAGHAPALFPVLVGLAFALLGSYDTVAIGVSAAAGSLTAGLVFWIGRRWFGTTVAVVAALFLSVCEYHLIFSRMALTDTLFTLLFWGALAALFEAWRRPASPWVLVAGVLVGLCWNAKYHGFMPLAIAALWTVGCQLQHTRLRLRPMAEALRSSRLLRAAMVAGLLFLPWAAAVELTVGYRSILAGQISHVQGIEGFSRSTPSILGFYLSSWTSPALLIAAGAGLFWAIRRRIAAGAFVAFSASFLAAATFLYLSFPRLALPLLPAICLLAALGVAESCRSLPSKPAKWVGAVAVFTILSWSFRDSLSVLNLKTDAYRRAAGYLKGLSGPQITQLSKNFYFYAMHSNDLYEIRWETPPRLDELLEHPQAVVAFDPVVHRLEEGADWLQARLDGLHLLRRFQVEMYEPGYFQGIDPHGLDQLPRRVAPALPGQFRIEVYRTVPPDPSGPLERPRRPGTTGAGG